MQFADTFKNQHLKSLIAFTLGSLNVISFAPYYFYPISFITLILFFSFNKEHSKKLSFFYGLGFFIFDSSFLIPLICNIGPIDVNGFPGARITMSASWIALIASGFGLALSAPIY
jgi:apolipoprotein N-acyltransferase